MKTNINRWTIRFEASWSDCAIDFGHRQVMVGHLNLAPSSTYPISISAYFQNFKNMINRDIVDQISFLKMNDRQLIMPFVNSLKQHVAPIIYSSMRVTSKWHFRHSHIAICHVINGWLRSVSCSFIFVNSKRILEQLWLIHHHISNE